MKEEGKYAFLNLQVLPARLNAQEVAWYLGFQIHEVSILAGAKMLEPLGRPPPNTPKFFAADSLEALRENRKWLEKATITISAYWRRKNDQKHANRNRKQRHSPSGSSGA